MNVCLICGKRPAAYKKVKHCRACHSEYNKSNYGKHHDREVMITNEILERGKSRQGGWSDKQMAALGVVRKRNKGWKDRLIGSKVCSGNVEKFLALKDAHIKNNQNTNLFGKGSKETKPARAIFSELGKHPDCPNWPNITEQEKTLLLEYAGQSKFNKADLMFVKRMRDKIFGNSPLGFLAC